MAKLTKKSSNGTSFHGTTIKCTAQQLIDCLGKPHWAGNDGEDKVNFEWDCETKSKRVFTIYDWKEYRILDLNEIITWHIGGFSFMDTIEAETELMDLLSKKSLQNA